MTADCSHIQESAGQVAGSSRVVYMPAAQQFTETVTVLTISYRSGSACSPACALQKRSGQRPERISSSHIFRLPACNRRCSREITEASFVRRMQNCNSYFTPSEKVLTLQLSCHNHPRSEDVDRFL